jgi:hypothetical protein
MDAGLFKYNQLNYKQNNLNVAQNNLATMDSNYQSSFEQNQQRSVLQEPDSTYEETVHYLNINSGDRNTTNYPLQYSYSLNLQRPYKNVTKVELISGIFPNTSGITSEPYLVIDIEELNTLDFTITANSHRGFAVCPLKSPISPDLLWCHIETGCAYHTNTEFKVPKELSRLTINIRNQLGAIYTFAGASTASNVQHSFVIKITTLDVCRKPLNLRNTY